MPLNPNTSNWNCWTISIFGFFVLAILGCFGFVVFCSFNKSELVAADYYEQEIGYQQHMERVERAKALAQPATVLYNPALRQVQVQMPAAHFGSNASGTVTLYRPSSSSMDRQIPLDTDLKGQQVIDVGDLASGPWRVKLLWTSHEREFLLEQNLIIPKSGAGLTRPSRHTR